MMDIKIDEDVKTSTTKCDKDFKCLVDNTYTLCRVTQSIHDEVLFVECLEESYCNYKMSFGFSNICNCPIRKELYKKFEI
ncbi:MAG: hypothetical protein ABFR82_11390 [Nitrospirota bacterium]